MTLEEQVKLVVQALEDKKAVDVKTYDVRGVSGLCDAFVVATGTAAPHLKGLVAGVQQAMRTAGAQVLPVESILFLLLRDAKHPAFKAVSRLMGRWAMQKRLLRLMCMEIIADCVDEIQPFIDEVLPNENLDLELQTENMDVVISADDYLI